MTTEQRRTFGAIIRCMRAQLRNGNESLANGPNNTRDNIFIVSFEDFMLSRWGLSSGK